MSTNSDQEAKFKDRQIRVFVSSTFRDMQEERDYLVKFIFPQLRKLCESRGVTWGEVDLRWGVTDEAAAEGKVLPICLEEIKRCRPYFIGLLGKRYGWIPEAVPPEVIEREPWLLDHIHGKKSVTELEILHGVLRDEAMHGQAFFYFRDPGYLNHLPSGCSRTDFGSEAPEARAKLTQLKQSIRYARDEEVCQLRENYRDPQQLGQWLLEDFTQLINTLFPEGSQPDPLTRESLDHAAYARSRERVYIGRPEYFTQLDAHATGSGDQPLVILGESGSGKSALLANWAARYRQAHPDAFVLEHYIGATPASADWATMLRRIMGEFKQRLGLTQDIPDNPDVLRSAFPNWLHMAAAKVQRSEDGGQKSEDQIGGATAALKLSGPIILVLDALNQLEDRDGAPDLLWLPPVLPENARLIVSTLPGRALNEITKRGWPVFKVEPLSVDERKELIRLFLHDYGRNLSPVRVDRIAAAPQSANPLYLRVLLDELRLFGQHERLEERIGYYLQAASPYELYGKVIARWEDSYEGGTDLVGDTLSLLWAARRGLTESELLDALSRDGQPLPRAAWSPLFLAMSAALVSRGGLLTFAHDFLRTAARDAYLSTESHQQQAHTRLADYFERQPAGPRRTDELPWQLAEARAWQRLHDLLADRIFFNDAYVRNQFEGKTFWAQIEADSTLRMVGAYRAQIEHPDAEADKAYLWRLSILLADTGHPDESLRLRSTLVEHFRATGDLDKQQGTLGLEALILQDRGDLGGAMALHQEAERICRQLGNLDGLSTTLGNQANILFARGDLNRAMALHKEEDRICRQLGNLDGLQATLCGQALILQACGDLDGAMALLKEEERICRQLGNLDSLSISLGNQAGILRTRWDLDGAMALLKDQERICRQLGSLEGLQRTFGNQGAILQDRGDLDGAMALHKEQERICRQLGFLADLQASLNKQAVILQDRGDLNGAMALHKEAEWICRRLGNLDGLSATLGNQAVILKARGDLDGAMALHKEEDRICRQLGNIEGLARSLANQALVRKQQGRTRDGLPLVEEAYRLASTHDYTALARQIEPLLNSVRQAATETAPSQISVANRSENVQFTVFRPQVVKPLEWYPLLAFAHLSQRRPDAPPDEPDPIQEVQRQAHQALAEQMHDYSQVTQDSTEAVPAEGEITFLPEVTGIEFNPPRAMFHWLEDVHRQDFRLRAAPELDGQTARGRLTVFLGRRIIADVPLTIRVEAQPQQPARATEVVSARPYRKVFASYSHKDLDVVEEFEHFVAAFGDRYLRDSTTLRAGEIWDDRLAAMIREADIFQLFWSGNSMRSDFVRQEWEHALSLNRQHFVRPVYWEEPLPEDKAHGLPPEGLRRLHFQRINCTGMGGHTASATTQAYNQEIVTVATAEVSRGFSGTQKGARRWLAALFSFALPFGVLLWSFSSHGPMRMARILSWDVPDITARDVLEALKFTVFLWAGLTMLTSLALQGFPGLRQWAARKRTGFSEYIPSVSVLILSLVGFLSLLRSGEWFWWTLIHISLTQFFGFWLTYLWIRFVILRWFR